MKRSLIWILVMILCLTAAIPAQAANIFQFTEKKVTLYEGETAETSIRREGNFDGDGEIQYSSAKPGIASVADDGTVTAVSKGQTVVTAALVRNGKTVSKTQINVNVLRAVKKVTLSTVNLSVYDADDPAIAGLMKDSKPEEAEAPEETPEEETEPKPQVILIAAGVTAALKATCTPEDASSKLVKFTSTDAGVLKISGTSMKALQRGECDLIVSSEQNPEVTETFHVVVIQPVKKITVTAQEGNVAVGSILWLTAVCSPDNASIKDVTWTSKTPNIATVDEYGMVTGIKRGSATIVATAADGSKAVGTIVIPVTQPVTSVSLNKTEATVSTGTTVQLKATASPADASDKTFVWSSSDDAIATVRNGVVTGVKAGACTITCASKSNPGVTAEAAITVTQKVKTVECVTNRNSLSIRVGETVQTDWVAGPEDATDKTLTYKSLQPKIASVDANGLVTALSRGTATIVATAADGSKKQGSVKVTVIQPVTGVAMADTLYYVQRGGEAVLSAVIQPRNANNQKVYWSVEDESIVTVTGGRSYQGTAYGRNSGTTTVTAVTEDGGFEATTRVKVGSFNEAVMIEDVSVDDYNNIKIVLRNMSEDIILQKINFRIECYGLNMEPIVCNTDGESTHFDGYYPYELYPMGQTVHGAFRFGKEALIDQPLGAVVLTITSWTDVDGHVWNIPEDRRPMSRWFRRNLNPPQGIG